MKKTLVSLITIGLLSIAAGPALMSAAPLGPTFPYLFDFTKGLEPFAVAGDTGKLGEKSLSLEIEDEGTPSTQPMANNYAGLTMVDGAEGSILYVYTTLPETGNTINLSFNVKAVVACGRCVPIAYVGREIPTHIGYFQKVGLPLGEEKGWSTRTFDAVLPLEQDVSGETPSGDVDPVEEPVFVVAIGYMNLDAAKSTQRVGLDDIDVQVSGPGK